MDAPRTLGRFELLGTIGEGGMGRVLRARDPDLGREVALKVLPDATAGDAERRARLLREARAAAKLQHPNITTIHEVGSAEGRDFIALEYVEGRTLAEVLAERRLEIDAILDLAIPLGDALAYAHARGVVHRDVKAQNVVVDERGAPKLLDFGLAKLDGDANAISDEFDASRTLPGTVFGTPNAMSPEQAAGRPVDARSDVFSFGSLLFELCTGRSPFARTSAAETVAAVLSEPAPDLRSIRRDVPLRLARVVERALRKRPEERFASMTELVDELRVLRAPRRSRSPLALAAGVVAGLAAIAVAIDLGGRLLGGDSSASDGSSADPVIETATAIAPRTLAVVPFESRSEGEVERAFASGIYDDVLVQLSKVSDLTVISRNSAVAAATRTSQVDEIGRLLGASAVLEGSVQRAGDVVRINLRLIDTRSRATLWAETFDRGFSVEAMLAIQTDVARSVASALDARLTEDEAARIAALPTNDSEAYELYLRARHVFERSGPGDDTAGGVYAMLRAAAARDPRFVEARTDLAAMLLLSSWLGEFDPSARAEALEVAHEVRALDPDHPEVLKLEGLIAYQDRRYERAEDLLARAERLQPNDVIIASMRGALARRRGDFAGALAHYERTARLDPLSPAEHIEYGTTLAFLGRRDEAEDAFERAAVIAPAFPGRALARAWNRLASPDVDPADAVRRALEMDPDAPAYERWKLFLVSGDVDAALAAAEAMPERQVTQAEDLTRAFVRARTLTAAGRGGGARADFEAALEQYTDEPLRVESADEGDATGATGIDARTLAGTALALAGLGRRDEALATIEAALETMPYERDAIVHPVLLRAAVDVCVLLGDRDRAVAYADRLLAVPSNDSFTSLARDVRMAPLVGYGPFEALRERHTDRR